MDTPRIYVDFNALPGVGEAMQLSFYGTLCDLASQRLLLREGLRVVLYDDSDGDEDMEFDATIRYRPNSESIMSRWVAELDAASFRRVPHIPRKPLSFPCATCNAELHDQLPNLDESSVCPSCGGGVFDFLRHTP